MKEILWCSRIIKYFISSIGLFYKKKQRDKSYVRIFLLFFVGYEFHFSFSLFVHVFFHDRSRK
jgi:hypothetical protein